jgi:NAD(P)-dependent dehydrogenase (short-subunit alcohol dehydrogenase family)
VLEGMEGKVAIVTGAGRGIGRAEALELGRLGVNVVVNDFGRSLSGEEEANPADAVVDEIVTAGGKAVANHADVADWNDSLDLVRGAIERFGRLDIVVNNAGFLRDRMIFNMSEEDFDAVVRVHLKGHFCMSRHVAGYWRDQAKASDEGTVYGRLINTTSESAMLGSAGQPNYGPAKAGIIALTLATAQALARYGVTANAMAPRARTRMTESMQSFGAMSAHEGEFDPFAPENVSPLVAYLASPASARVNGQVFIVYGKSINVVDGPSFGQEFTVEDSWTPEKVDGALTSFYEQRKPIADGYIIRGTRA